MVIRTTKITPHWNYLLALERDVERLSRYVEFDDRNFACFSIEIARVLLAAGAEVDVVCKQICHGLNAKSTAKDIHRYRLEITAAYPKFCNRQVLFSRHGLTLEPWDEWKSPTGVPLWWTAYNKTKHERHSKFDLANLKNALNAVAGLYVTVLHLYRFEAEHGELRPNLQLLRPGADYFRGVSGGSYDEGFTYDLA